MPKKYRAAVIGHTGKGNYGHGLDRVWLDLPEVEVVAVSDPSEKGLAGAKQRLSIEQGFRDYHQMLQEVKPDLVSICPRWLDQHHDMLVACVEAGVRGVYCEKPLCQTLTQADNMEQLAREANMKVAVAHQTRYSPILPVVKELIDSGRIGEPLEFRGRGKEDHRGGGEDLWVLGTHVFNLIQHLGGEAVWCFARAFSEGDPVSAEHVAPGNEGIGLLAATEIHATYGLSQGATAFFDSVRHKGQSPTRFGLMIHGSEGIIAMNTGYLPTASWLPDGSWTPARTGKEWIKISSAGPGKPEPLTDGGLAAGNILACQDLIRAMEDDREPESSLREAKLSVEMIVGVFASHVNKRPVELPLKDRDNPLGRLLEQ